MPLKLACFWQEPLWSEKSLDTEQEKKQLLKEVKGPRPPIPLLSFIYLINEVKILFRKTVIDLHIVPLLEVGKITIGM